MSRLRLFAQHDAKKAFKDACERYDLVYFGHVSQHTDEHQMVRGFTLSPSHVDRHYCVGTVAGHDVILLERTDTVSFPDKPSRAYSWLIVQIDLRREVLTHILLSRHSYDATLYDHLMVKYHDMRLLDQAQLPGYDPKFHAVFRVIAAPQHLDRVAQTLSSDITATLGHHFGEYDYELLASTLLIYLPTKTPTLGNIEAMLKSGIWLADEINKTTQVEL